MNKNIDKETIKKDGKALFYLEEKDRTKELIELAFKTCGEVIRYIDNPTEEEKIHAVKTTPEAIKYIKNPSTDLKRLALTLDKRSPLYGFDYEEEDLLYALEKNPSLIPFIDSPNEKMIDIVLDKDIENYKYINFNRREYYEYIKWNIKVIPIYRKYDFNDNNFFNILGELIEGEWLFSIDTPDSKLSIKRFKTSEIENHLDKLKEYIYSQDEGLEGYSVEERNHILEIDFLDIVASILDAIGSKLKKYNKRLTEILNDK